MPSFVAVGELLVDVVAEGSGHEARIRVRPGGSTFTAAVAAARAGAEARAIGAVGSDLAGRAIIAELGERGVQADVTVVADQPTGAVLVVDGDTRVDRGASTLLRLPERIEADAVLISGEIASADALARARAHWVAVDVAGLGAVPRGADAVFADAAAARALTGEEPETAVRLLGTDHRLACVTTEADGLVAMLDGRFARLRPDTHAVRGRSARDAFAGGILVALAAGQSFPDALREGSRLASAVELSA